MAGDWIKIRTSLLDDPDVMRLSDLLDIDDSTTIGLLVRFWAWADKQTPDGNDIAISSARLDRLIGRQGFAEAMRQVGWLSGRDGSLSLPRFERHNGNSAKARALEAEAKRLRRQMSDNSDENVGQVSDTLSDQRREEKRRDTEGSQHAREAPQLDLVLQWAEAKMAPNECAEAFWNEMEGCGWVDSRGRPVLQPRNAFNAYAVKWQANDARSKQRSQGGGKPSPTAHQAKPPGLFGSSMDKYRTDKKEGQR